MEIQVKNIEGKVVKKIALADEVFDIPMNEHLLHVILKSYRANRRQGTHATLNFRRVSGTGKKPFKQKGTGGARQGSMIAPHMPGGAVAHGPMPRCYREYPNKKTKKIALSMALADKLRHGKLTVVDDFSIKNYSTKNILKVMKALSLQKALFSDMTSDDYLYKSVRNIYGSGCLSVNDINAENVVAHENLVVSEKAILELAKRLA